MVAGVLRNLIVGSLVFFAISTRVDALQDRATILDFIARYEAPSGYDSIHTATREAPPIPLTQMLLHEVLSWQRDVRWKVVSTAVGRYQFTYRTLTRLSRDYNIDPDRLFDDSLQDELGNLLLDECGYGKRHLSSFGNCLAIVWAALPRVTGKDAGRSVWHGVAGNRALVSREMFVRFLKAGNQSELIESTGTGTDKFVMPLTRPKIQFHEIRHAIDRNINQARENESLGESIVVTFQLDPYRIQ